MPGSMTSSWFRSFLAVMFYPAFLAAASLPVVHVLGIRDAVFFGLAALAWLMFGRLIVFGSNVNVPVDGSKSSAVFVVALPLLPPASKTLPF